MTSQPERVPPPVPSPEQLPAGLTNGHTPSMRLMEALPQMLFQAVAAALQQARPAAMRCVTCLLERSAWAAQHQAQMQEADRAWRAAVAEMEARPEEDRVPVDPGQFIPPELRQGPPVLEAAVTVAGTTYCPQHVPGAGPQQASQLLVAQAHITPGMLART